MTEKKVKISVVIPIKNEQGNIIPLDKELRKVISKITSSYEVIYINDGSTDGSLKDMKSLNNVKIIDLNRNYGQAVALDAGFKASVGDIVISMDGDCQNDPNDIPQMLRKLRDEKLDVVTGWRKDRKDNRNIRFITRIARLLRKIFISDGINDSGCTLRVYRKEAVKSLDIGGEMHRYILALLRWKGFRIGEIEVNHRPRKNGVGKYGSSKALRGFIDLVYIWFIHKYSQRPLHLFGYMAMISFAFGAGSAFWSIYGKLAWGMSLNRNGWFFLSAFFLLASAMFFSFGIVIDLLIRTHLIASPHEKRYYIREVIEK